MRWMHQALRAGGLKLTEVVRYKCKGCGKEFGTLGMHGYSPKEGSGELPVVCRKCKDILVAQFKDKKMVRPNCPKCKGPLELFDARCPACGEKKLVFEDVRMSGFEQEAVDMTKTV